MVLSRKKLKGLERPLVAACIGARTMLDILDSGRQSVDFCIMCLGVYSLCVARFARVFY